MLLRWNCSFTTGALLQGSSRALVAAAEHFARESHMNELAEESEERERWLRVCSTSPHERCLLSYSKNHH
jgi:hypothetical protein